MDDVVIERSSPTPIPILSPALHCVAMTALVYLRTSFGYTFLRPKAFFFLFTFLFALFFIFAWNEPLVWRGYRAVCVFGAGAVVLYWTHLFLTFSSEWRKKAREDHYPGTSHMKRFASQVGRPTIPEGTLHFWVEPGIVLFVSAVLRIAFGERHLSAWLAFVALCMVGREAINHWTAVRRRKAGGEGRRAAEQQGDALSDDSPTPEPPKPTRTEPVNRERKRADAGEVAEEQRFAKILRLRPPYALDKAEENFRALVKLEHPDAHENSPESNAATAELKEAIEFFRKRLGA